MINNPSFLFKITKILITIVTINFLLIIGFYIYDFEKTFLIMTGSIVGTLFSSIYYSTVIITLYINWRILNYTQKTKLDKTLMILFLGPIGLLLWIPSKEQFEKMSIKDSI